MPNNIAETNHDSTNTRSTARRENQNAFYTIHKFNYTLLASNNTCFILSLLKPLPVQPHTSQPPRQVHTLLRYNHIAHDPACAHSRATQVSLTDEGQVQSVLCTQILNIITITINRVDRICLLPIHFQHRRMQSHHCYSTHWQ